MIDINRNVGEDMSGEGAVWYDLTQQMALESIRCDRGGTGGGGGGGG